MIDEVPVAVITEDPLGELTGWDFKTASTSVPALSVSALLVVARVAVVAEIRALKKRRKL